MEDGVTQLIIQYRYLILLPLSFIEGPIVAFFAGTLSAAGYFNIYFLAIFFLVRDVLVDFLCYLIGKFLGRKEFTHRWLNRIHINEEDIENVRYMWHTHPGKTMFFSKLSYGVAAGFIIVAGMVEMPIRKFLAWGTLIAITHYGALLLLGYFFGASFGSIAGIVENIQYVIGGLIVLGTVYYFVKKSINKGMKKEEEKAKLEQKKEAEYQAELHD
jgi:membrane protein DedA with SNARE-associated domain